MNNENLPAVEGINLTAVVLDTMSSLIIVLDRQGRILLFNRACEQTTGYTAAEVTGKPFWDLFLLPEELPQVREVFTNLLSGEFPNQHENYWVTHSGDRRLISWSNTAIKTAEGSVEYVIGTGIDITERRAAEEALRESEQRYRSLFKNNHAVMLLIDPNTGYIVDANPAACKFYGYNLEELVGMKITAINMLTAKEVFQEMERARQEKRNQFFFQHRLASGEAREVEVYSGPIRVGGKGLLYSIVHDITKRKRAEESLKESEARERAKVAEFEAIMNTVQAAIWLAHDPECRQVTGNRAAYEMLNLPYGSNLSKDHGDEQLMRHVHFFQRGIELQPHELPLQAALARGEEIREFEEDIVLDDGQVRHLIGNVSPMEDEGGRMWGAVAAFIDISELKRAEEALRRYASELERSNRDLQDFAFIASHDLQEPLRKIRAFGELLETRSRGRFDQQERDYLERMIFAAERMRRMIDDLLTYSRITTRAQPFAPVDLNQVAEEVLSDLEMRILSTGGRVQLSRLPQIEADMPQMQQLMQNLIGNALKFHLPGVPPVVKVYAEEFVRPGQPVFFETAQQEFVDGQGKEEMVRIIVEDNGIGLDMEYRERIFQPFQRLHGRSEYEGSGIGLAICRRIVERHHGEITVQSEPGHGATFIVSLPTNQLPSGR
jgi:PAS domain S-box-containing protein